MNTTGIRLEVEPWLYNILIEEQERQRQKSGRKQSLSSIILAFCTKGLSVSGLFVQNKAHSVQKTDDSVQDFEGFVQNHPEMYETNLDEIAKLKEAILRQGQELQRKERHLATREQEIKEKEVELVERTQEALRQWNELLDNKEKSQQVNLDAIRQSLLNEQQKTALSDKTEANRKLKLENIQLKEDIIKTIRKIDRQTEKNILFDYLIPFLPSVISIIGFFVTNKKIESIQELSPVQTEIGKIMKKLSDADKKNLSTKLEESLKAFSAPSAVSK
jgi:hypothetical protein